VGEAAPVVEHVTSRDGTSIGFHRSFEGPPLVLLHGATGAHWSFRYILPALVGRFTLYAVDRRGRGESGDADGYALEREFEDVAAIVDSLDEPANVFGHSYGATVALATPNIGKLVLYEASPGISVVPDEYLERIEQLVGGGEGRRRSSTPAARRPTRWTPSGSRTSPHPRCSCSAARARTGRGREPSGSATPSRMPASPFSRVRGTRRSWPRPSSSRTRSRGSWPSDR